ncbi:prospero homeobox protein 2 [Erpetoichthys calabaricus]|uniref:prospero homeobox protein 2 n=1 Tax=Erpetoichthys calabaricus TaxID=27687 RepID=UPI002234426D|nr:prospero homeobox protein 2 [Erpetoichthys calabaricus]
MNKSILETSMHSSTDCYLESDENKMLYPCLRRNLFEDSLGAYPNSSIISQLLQKSIHNKRLADDNFFYLSASALPSSTTADCGVEDRSSSSSRESTMEPLSPESHLSSSEGERPINENHQAKRARVENIIRGMAASPNEQSPGEGGRTDPFTEVRESYRENKRKQRLPQHQYNSYETSAPKKWNKKEDECQKLKEQLQSMQRLLRQLQEKFFQVYDFRDSTFNEPEGGVSTENSGDKRCKVLTETFSSTVNCDYGDKTNKSQIPQTVNFQASSGVPSVLDDANSISEVLKYQLSRAVNESVDSVLKSFSSTFFRQLSQMLDIQDYTTSSTSSTENNTETPCPQTQLNTEEAFKVRYHDCYNAETSANEDQNEALSLVVRKTPVSQEARPMNQIPKKHYLPQTALPMNYSPVVHENQILEHILKYGPHRNFSSLQCISPSVDRSPPQSVDFPWEAMKVKSKVTSTHLAHQLHEKTLSQVPAGSLCLPHVKMECADPQSLADRSPYMSLNIQEGLTPNHLKKAKLMFFYTRYPSSNVLKTFFPDVKFNRCITSQLIKWFSNFREFYYIQMEKFARQAIMDGINNRKDLVVTRDSELFRALNMHYNKANDFQVPERFLEVAEITLQEFFNAISMAKDCDPSWKKAIYKVICKLDSEVPDQFKSSNFI